MDKKNDSSNESAIDNYIITTCITLLAAYSFIITIKKPDNNILCYSIIISVFCLAAALLEALWHKVRWKIRINQFESKKEKIIRDSADDIASALEDFLNPRIQLLQKQQILDCIVNKKEMEKIDEKKVVAKITKEEHEPMRRLVLSFCKNLGTDLQEAHKKSFLMPLDENFSKIKFLIDILSRRTQYYFFTIGILFFFISILLNLLNQKI